MKKAFAGRDTDQVGKYIKNGDMLHVNNKDAQIVNLPPPPKQLKVKEEKKEEDAEMKDEGEKKPEGPRYDTSGKLLKAPKEVPVDDGKIRDSKG